MARGSAERGAASGPSAERPGEGEAGGDRRWDPEILEAEQRTIARMPDDEREELSQYVGRNRAVVQDLRDAGLDVVSVEESLSPETFHRSCPVLGRRLEIEEDLWVAYRLAHALCDAPQRCAAALPGLVASARRFRAQYDHVLFVAQALGKHATANDREVIAPMADRMFWGERFDGRGMVLEFVLLRIDKPLAGRTAQAVLREVHPPADATWAQANPVRSALTGVARLKRHDLRELVEARLEDPIPGLREGARETIKKLDRDRDRQEARR